MATTNDDGTPPRPEINAAQLAAALNTVDKLAASCVGIQRLTAETMGLFEALHEILADGDAEEKKKVLVLRVAAVKQEEEELEEGEVVEEGEVEELEEGEVVEGA